MAKTVAIIPARGGSKRIPKKNTRLLEGKPLIYYSIQHALDSDAIDTVIVSTDDAEIAKIAEGMHCRVMMRPASLATDTARTIDVLKHCVIALQDEGAAFDYVVLLQPTVPIRAIDDVNKAIEILKTTGCDSVVSHIPVDYFHPNRMKKIVDGRIVAYGEEEIPHVSRDTLPKAYYRDGSIYAMKTSLLLEKETLFGDDVRPLMCGREFFVNIDEERDWCVAELLMREYNTTHTVKNNSQSC